MIKVKIFSVGKTKESWLEEACEEYRKRLQPWASIESIWTKDDFLLEQMVQKESRWIALDPKGQQMDSKTFAAFIDTQATDGGSRLNFVIGGPDGLPASLRKKGTLASLSKMTFTHQMTRVVLLEQLYRAFTLLKGIPYHK